MKDIGILETITLKNARGNNYSYLLIEKILIECKYDWLQCVIVENELLGWGYLPSQSSGKKYKVLVKYSYHNPQRFDRVWVTEPYIKYHPMLIFSKGFTGNKNNSLGNHAALDFRMAGKI